MGKVWHYLQDGQARGPIPEEQVRELLASGALVLESQVWCEGMAEWSSLRNIPELVPAPEPALIALAEPPQLELAHPNPYAAPRAPVMQMSRPGGESQGAVSAGALEMLRLTKPWVRFLGVLGIIGMVLLSLGGVAVAIAGAAMKSNGSMLGLGLVYLLMGVLYLPPIIYLNRYANRIGDLLRSEAAEDLEAALTAQKSFWRYAGIVTLCVLCLYAIALLVGVGVAAAGLSHKF